jgi:hypothetical protein
MLRVDPLWCDKYLQLHEIACVDKKNKLIKEEEAKFSCFFFLLTISSLTGYNIFF